MIECYKISNNIYDKEVTSGILEMNTSNQKTRGHSLKLAKSSCRTELRRNFFSQRVTNAWNSLPEQLVRAKTVKHFEIGLDNIWESQDFKWDYLSPLNTYSKLSATNVENQNLTNPNVEIVAGQASFHKDSIKVS